MQDVMTNFVGNGKPFTAEFPDSMLASLARMSLASGSVGTYWRAASRYSKKFALIPAVVAGRKSIFGAGGGGYCLRNAESGCPIA